MRVLITQETDWLIKTPAQQHHLSEMLSLRGHRVRVIDYELLWKKQGKKELVSKRDVYLDISKIHRNASVTVIRPGILKIPGLVYASLIFSHKREIERQIEEFNPDIIVGFGILNSYLALKIAANNNIPFIYYWIDVLDRLIPFKAFQVFGKIIENQTLRKADKVLTINERLKDYVVKMGALSEQTSVLRAGIDFDQFKYVRENINSLDRRNVEKESITLFFMGWLYHFSGLKEVALKLSKIKQNNIKLVIVGEGDAYDDLKQIQTRYNLHDRLILTGRRPYHEMPAYIAASDICILPAYPSEKIMQDIVPIKTYEYMAMSKPVICTKLPGVMTEFGENNGIVYVDKPEEVLDKAVEIITNNKAAELGDKARQFAEKNSWDKITDEFENILLNAIKEKKRGKLPGLI